MRTARIAALAALLMLLVLPAGTALAAARHSAMHHPDPCDSYRTHICQQAPEAPAALLYPAAAGLVLTVYLCVERRRRRPSARV
jgi:hypothetical protein